MALLLVILIPLAALVIYAVVFDLSLDPPANSGRSGFRRDSCTRTFLR
jgi:hypothetical protein